MLGAEELKSELKKIVSKNGFHLIDLERLSISDDEELLIITIENDLIPVERLSIIAKECFDIIKYAGYIVHMPMIGANLSGDIELHFGVNL